MITCKNTVFHQNVMDGIEPSHFKCAYCHAETILGEGPGMGSIPCPFCKGMDLEITEKADNFNVSCDCGAEGAQKDSVALAIKAWNTRFKL